MFHGMASCIGFFVYRIHPAFGGRAIPSVRRLIREDKPFCVADAVVRKCASPPVGVPPRQTRSGGTAQTGRAACRSDADAVADIFQTGLGEQKIGKDQLPGIEG